MEEKEREINQNSEVQALINTLMESRIKAVEDEQKIIKENQAEINNRITRIESKQDNILELMTEFKEENKNRSQQRDNNLNSAVMTIVTAAITGVVGYILAFIFANK